MQAPHAIFKHKCANITGKNIITSNFQSVKVINTCYQEVLAFQWLLPFKDFIFII